MKRKTTKLMAALALLLFIASPITGLGQMRPTTTLNIGAYAADNGWVNSTQYMNASVSNVSFNATGGGNTGKYFESDETWRFYANENATLTITVPTGGTLSSVTATFSVKDNGVLKYGSSTVTSGQPIVVSGSSAVFTISQSSGNKGKVFFTEISVVYTTGATYTITAQSNNENYGTVTLNGSVITGNVADGCRYAMPAYSVSPANSAAVSQNGDLFSVTPSANTTVTINFEPIPTHTVTFYVNGETTTQTFAEGDEITFPEDPADIEGKTFMGWVDEPIEGTIDEEPEFVISATIGSYDESFYAVFADVEGNGPDSYEKLESNSYDANAKYVIAAEQAANSHTMWYFYSYGNVVDENVNWGVMTTTPTTNSPVKFTLSDDESGLVAQADDGNYLAGLTTGKFKMSSTSTTIALTSSGYIKNSSTGSYYLRHNYNGGSGGLRWYNNTTTGMAAYFYKVIPGVTYSNYCTTIAVSTDPSITANPATIEIAADEMDGITNVTFANMEITDPWETCHVTFYDATGTTEMPQPDWVIEALVAEDGDAYLISCSVYANEGPARSAYFKVFTNDENEEIIYSNLVTISQAEYAMPSGPITYTKVSSVESGRTYVIGSLGGAMGVQNPNNRAAVEVSSQIGDDFTIFVEGQDVYEFVIESAGENGDGETVYTIYDARYNNNAGGYLYAASSSSNHLKTDSEVDDNGKWTITFGEWGAASIVAQGDKTRNEIRYNSNSGNRLFSCYNYDPNNSSQQELKDVYLFIKDETTLSVEGYGDDDQVKTGWSLIASPFAAVIPSAANGFLTDDFDLYRFDQSGDSYGNEWLNYKTTPFYLLSGKGYLYASATPTTLVFSGVPYNGDGAVTLEKKDCSNASGHFEGWNLVGNPFAQTAYVDRDCYVMHEDGDRIIAGDSRQLEAMQGAFVIAESDGEEMSFSTTAPNNTDAKVVMNVVNNHGVVDRAIVRFGEGRQLPKFQLNPNHTKVYFTKDNKDYAVVRSANEGEMPVNFKAETRGTYTINVDAENVEMNYLHLIDNLTGTDVDLLQTPSYTFNANTGDYANRFRLVFNATGIEENDTEANTTFAYFNGNEWVVNNSGNATLQVIDMMGRVLSSKAISGNAIININQAAGIYMLRLVNGENAMVQKVVVR